MDWKNKDEVREYMRAYKKAHNSNQKYYEAHKETLLSKNKEYREKNKEKLKEYSKEYRSSNAEKLKLYKDSHKEETKEYNRQYYLKRRKEIIASKTEYNKTYTKTKMGRAQRQYQQYKRMDVRNGFDEAIDFDAKWIVDNIYSKTCTHCGESDWHKLGCNRLDNSKPHTIDNVEPCCFHCNCVLNGKDAMRKAKRGRN